MNMVKQFKSYSILLLTACMLSFATIASAEEDPIGVVISVTGEVNAKGSEAGKRALARGTDFFVNDVISTGSGATVSLRFLDGSVIELMGLTEYKVNQYQYAEASPDDDAFSSELIKGGLRAISGKMGERNPDGVKINAQMTTLTIRGTEWTQVAGGCDVMQMIAQQLKACNNVLFQIEGGEISVKNDITGEIVNVNAQDQLRGLVVTNNTMTQVDSITSDMVNDLIGSENNFLNSSTELEGETDVDASDFPCGI